MKGSQKTRAYSSTALENKILEGGGNKSKYYILKKTTLHPH
jgi:hypothetical protein